MAMHLSEAAAAMSGTMLGADTGFRGISTDSRTIEAGALFFALRGPSFDGHDYIEMARSRGAAAAAVSVPCASALPQVQVDDTRLALGTLAANWRGRFELPVIAITGSNGKTTVRAMTQAILSGCGQAMSTRGNLNNDIGLPLTLARLGPADRFAVLEMGANHPGEIDYLASIAAPTIGVITNAGPAHLEGFGSVEGVARAKGELFARLGHDGIAVINADDRHAPLWHELAAHCRQVTFGLQPGCDYSAQWQGDAGGSDIDLATPQGRVSLRLPLAGRHNVMNALAAAAVAAAAGAGLDDIRRGLQSVQAVAGRFNVLQLPGGITLIDDTYNANPGSLQVALDILRQSPGESWLVLGEMGELGAEGRELHRAAGAQARRAGVSRVYGIGELAAEAVAGFAGSGGAYDSAESLLADLQRDLHGPLQILVKGSRRMRMERVVEALRGAAQGVADGNGGGN